MRLDLNCLFVFFLAEMPLSVVTDIYLNVVKALVLNAFLSKMVYKFSEYVRRQDGRRFF